MRTYPNLRARYSKGTLKLKEPLRLPDRTEVRVTVMPLEDQPRRRKTQTRHTYPTRTVRWESLKELSGILSLGGDALADSEALYDSD